MKMFKYTVAALFASAALAGVASARDQIQMAGSSTVLPFAKIVAESFAETYPDFKAPVVESGGTGAGLKEFCKGVGPETIDIANASRKIKDSEMETCKAAGVTDVLEVKFGYDGIVFATDKAFADLKLEPKDVYLAVAAEVIVDGKLVANPAKKWSDVNKDLPAVDIAAFIPGEKHGTREVFEQKLLDAGCAAAKAPEVIKTLITDEKAAAAKCHAVRKDGVAVDIDGDYSETLARIDSNKNAVGVFGLSFFENNADKLKVASISGVVPSGETVASGEYPVSRPLFFYVKKAHLGVIAGLKEYVNFFVSDAQVGPDSVSVEQGLISMPADELKKVQAEIASAAK
ncbi:MAG: hypothetical protein RIR97_1114 [Pseudomonadota bacterium]